MKTDQFPVELFLNAAKKNLLIDVRSPTEFNHAHIPGAVNIPIFNDEERSKIGTLYKQQSREVAIKTGLDFFGTKMRKIVEEVEGKVQGQEFKVEREDVYKLQTPQSELRTHNSIFIYCWRGGMRSAAFAWLLSFYGFRVTVLTGGYKAYRNYVLQTFQLPFRFNLIGGYTGSGKTELLHELRSIGEKVIDLEHLASHKGSAFGNINMPPQPTQEMFENLLSGELLDASGNYTDSDLSLPFRGTGGTSNSLPLRDGEGGAAIWIEDESQRIGQLNIPHTLWQTLRNSPVYFLNIPLEERLRHLMQEYSNCASERLTNAIERISKQLGGVETKTTLEFLHLGNVEACFSVLLKYYDKKYLKSLNSRENLPSLLTNIDCTSVGRENVYALLRKPAIA